MKQIRMSGQNIADMKIIKKIKGKALKNHFIPTNAQEADQGNLYKQNKTKRIVL